MIMNIMINMMISHHCCCHWEFLGLEDGTARAAGEIAVAEAVPIGAIHMINKKHLCFECLKRCCCYFKIL